MPEPLISVIIPTWNRADTIGKAMDSVLSQTFTDFELLICDDGSDDSTKLVIESYNDSRIKWIDGERFGRPAGPRNRGIRQAKGKWLAFLDSDDSWIKDKLQKQIDTLNKTRLKACCTNAARIVSGTEPIEDFVYWNRNNISFRNLLAGNMVINSSVIVATDLVKHAGGFPEDKELTAVEDYALWLRVATKTDFAYINEQLVEYKDEPKTSIRSENPGFLANHKKVLDNFRSWAVENNIDKDYIKNAKFWLLSLGSNPTVILRNAIIKLKREKGKL